MTVSESEGGGDEGGDEGGGEQVMRSAVGLSSMGAKGLGVPAATRGIVNTSAEFEFIYLKKKLFFISML